MGGLANLHQGRQRFAQECKQTGLPVLLLNCRNDSISISSVTSGNAQGSLEIAQFLVALGAGIFFIGYAIFEVPSNRMLHRVGARLWLSRIMITWGLVFAAMIFTQDETTFYVLRFLLCVAEAGFSPGVILYLTYWFPAQRRGQALGSSLDGVASTGRAASNA